MGDGAVDCVGVAVMEAEQDVLYADLIVAGQGYLLSGDGDLPEEITMTKTDLSGAAGQAAAASVGSVPAAAAADRGEGAVPEAAAPADRKHAPAGSAAAWCPPAEAEPLAASDAG